MTTPKQIAIIGAGPAGLMAAEQLAAKGCAVTVYDQMPNPARKLLIAGRGGLNLTHSEPLEPFCSRYGAAAGWMEPFLRAFTPSDLRHWCEGLGQETFVGSSGRVFPRSMKAVPLLRAWLQRLEQLGVHYAPRHRWMGWDGAALHFVDGQQRTILVTPDTTLLALGGASWPRLGSDGGWVTLLSAQGVESVPLRPSNCGFITPWSAYFSNRFAGHPLKSIAITHQGTTHKGEAMITEQGIEGGAIYALSAALRDAIDAQGHAMLMLDLRPQCTLSALTDKLSTPRGNRSLSSYLQRAGFSPLVIALLREVVPAAEVAQATPASLAGWLKALPLRLTATAGMARAISSAGGVARHALTHDLMCLAKPGVFVAGEMIDWEAPTGGYLLQGCFSTAVAAARGMVRYGCD